MKGRELTFKMTGKEFDDGYNLYYLHKGLANLHTLIDKSYLTIEDKHRMTDRDREILQVKAYNIRPGSFQTDFLIQLSSVSASLIPLVTSMSPADIWNLVTESFGFLNTVLAANGRGESLSYQNSDNGKINVVNGDNNIIIQVHPDVLHNVKKSNHHYEELTRLISPEKGVENISVINKETLDAELYIGVEEKVNFEKRKWLHPEPILFKGKFTRADEGFSGKVRVLEGSKEIPAGEYLFEFLIKNDPEKLRSCFLNEKTIHALRETILDPVTLEQRIFKLKIIEVN